MIGTPPEIDTETLSRDRAAAVGLFVAEKRRWFVDAFKSGAGPGEINRSHSHLVDELISNIYADVSREGSPDRGVAIVALGGYGRCELGLMSDIDLLFLHDGVPDGAIRQLTDAILYPLWDAGMDVGGATRTLSDCASVINHDTKALTALLDTRLITGDKGLFRGLEGLIELHFSDERQRRRFIETKLKERAERLGRFGASIYLLQPNVKEGEGGLRDFHTLLWILKVLHPGEAGSKLLSLIVCDGAGRKSLLESVDFLWRVRHALHLADDKRTDRLSDALQEKVAMLLDFKAGTGASATEHLMSAYYRHAGIVHVQCSRTLERIRLRYLKRKLVPRWLERRRVIKIPPHLLKDRPILSLQVFATSRRKGKILAPETLDAIASFICRERVAKVCGEAASAVWREIFSGLNHLDRVLLQMQECGVLEAFFPEMAPMMHRVQHDGLHLFTAGIHSIRAVGELSRLVTAAGRRDSPQFARALKDVERRHVLSVATLFHDIGKGYGEDHTVKGGELVREIATRLGYSGRDACDMKFLVRSHLLMATLAFRRDVHDPGLIERFSQTVQSVEMLAMLYLLTFADMRSVGPNVWNEWKGGLLNLLYQRTRSQLVGQGMDASHDGREAGRNLAAIRGVLGKSYDEAALKGFLAGLPERYIQSVGPDSIAAHFMMAREIGSMPVATLWRDHPELGCTELSVVTRDRPGLFACITGVLANFGANIVSAELYTDAHGVAIDIIRLTDSVNKPLDDHEVWRQIQSGLASVITGGGDVERFVGGRFKRRLLSWSQRVRPPEVIVDNDTQAAETVVEIVADDRRGLLYAIAGAFHELGLSINRAIITTHIDRVTDVFYIRDSEGKKVVERDQLAAMREHLLEALEG